MLRLEERKVVQMALGRKIIKELLILMSESTWQVAERGIAEHWGDKDLQ